MSTLPAVSPVSLDAVRRAKSDAQAVVNGDRSQARVRKARAMLALGGLDTAQADRIWHHAIQDALRSGHGDPGSGGDIA